MTREEGTPTCPRCRTNPRVRVQTGKYTGMLRSYCVPCSTEIAAAHRVRPVVPGTRTRIVKEIDTVAPSTAHLEAVTGWGIDRQYTTAYRHSEQEDCDSGDRMTLTGVYSASPWWRRYRAREWAMGPHGERRGRRG